jgi:hypothetical protein
MDTRPKAVKGYRSCPALSATVSARWHCPLVNLYHSCVTHTKRDCEVESVDGA